MDYEAIVGLRRACPRVRLSARLIILKSARFGMLAEVLWVATSSTGQRQGLRVMHAGW